MRFTRAYPESLPTICARRAIHTGIRTWPFRNRVELPGETFQPAGWQPIPQDQTTLAEILISAGYYTVLYSDTQPLFHPSMNFQRGFRVFDWIRGQERDRYRSKVGVPEDLVQENVVPGNDESMVDKVRQYLANTQGRENEEDYFAPQLFTRGIEFLEQAKGGEPFLLVLDSFDPHEPWDPPEEYVNLYSEGYEGPDPIVPNYGSADWIGEKELERMRALYAAEVTMVDRWLGRFLDKLESTGLMDDTLLVVLSDHGVALGEHGATGKPFGALWPELTDIPFFIRHPEGSGAGQTSDYFVSTHDVAPTILGGLGVLPLRADGRQVPHPPAPGRGARAARPLHAGLRQLRVGQGRPLRHVRTRRPLRNTPLRRAERPQHGQRHSRRQRRRRQAHVRRLRPRRTLEARCRASDRRPRAPRPHSGQNLYNLAP